jgi:hypothetical protein
MKNPIAEDVKLKPARIVSWYYDGQVISHGIMWGNAEAGNIRTEELEVLNLADFESHFVARLICHYHKSDIHFPWFARQWTWLHKDIQRQPSGSRQGDAIELQEFFQRHLTRIGLADREFWAKQCN